MDWLTFLSSAISSLAWPATVVTIVIILRKPLRRLLFLVKKLRYRDLEVEFGQGLQKVAEAFRELPSLDVGPLSALAALSPRTAVLEAWHRVELAAVEAARRLNYKGDDFGTTPPTLTSQDLASLEHKVNKTVVRLLQDLRALRNEAAHAPDFALSKASALEYAASADAVARYLEGLRQSQQPSHAEVSRPSA